MLAADLDAYLLQIMESLSKLRVTKLTSCSGYHQLSSLKSGSYRYCIPQIAVTITVSWFVFSFAAIGLKSLLKIAAALLVYDLLDKDSFDRVQSWVKELRNMASKNIVLSLAGNKSDMDKLRQVNLQDTERFAPYFLMLIGDFKTS